MPELRQLRLHVAQPDGAACTKGCAACCRKQQHVAVTAEELALLRGEAEAWARAVRRVDGEPCPFLEDDVCSVYSERPLRCRGFHSLSRASCEGGPGAIAHAGAIRRNLALYASAGASFDLREALRGHVVAARFEFLPGHRALELRVWVRIARDMVARRGPAGAIAYLAESGVRADVLGANPEEQRFASILQSLEIGDELPLRAAAAATDDDLALFDRLVKALGM